MQAYDRNGIIAGYDKRHLVPFGEYLPFENQLRAIGLRQFVNVIGGFTAGNMQRRLEVPGLPRLLPLICYEIIFPGEFELGAQPAEFMLNITNDAWFGFTPGPYQHLAQARLRAVEFGMPVIRAANSGISAVIDPYGRFIGKTALGKTDILDAPLPKALSSTLYRQVIWFSYGTVMICFGLFAALGLALPASAHTSIRNLTGLL
jgi:apolipoprotein N-acyltransferase